MGVTLKPPFTYFGGKTINAGRIAALLPAHGHYVEPYCGSLAVLLAKSRSGMETVNDLDRALITFWRVLRERPAELARRCALTPHSLAEFRDAEDVDAAGDELETARRIWIRLTQGRAGTLCEGFQCVLIEQNPSSAELIKTRLSKPIQPAMFGIEAS